MAILPGMRKMLLYQRANTRRLEQLYKTLVENYLAKMEDQEEGGSRRGSGRGPQWTKNEVWWGLFNSGGFGGTPVLTGGAGGKHDDGSSEYWDPNQAP